MRRTVLPQAMRVIIPPTGNELISMLEDHLAGDRGAVFVRPHSIASREIAARTFGTRSDAAGRRDLVPDRDEHP